ncbi:hypothetical protein, partial [Bradyrhizobium sp.]|uniref:hypothetical protein n=2 Tax=Bradyrhizobium TaxID=374 RepID=UPI0029050051
PSTSRLTLPPETITSCYPETRLSEFQPNSGRHPDGLRKLKQSQVIAKPPAAWNDAASDNSKWDDPLGAVTVFEG